MTHQNKKLLDIRDAKEEDDSKFTSGGLFKAYRKQAQSKEQQQNDVTTTTNTTLKPSVEDGKAPEIDSGSKMTTNMGRPKQSQYQVLREPVEISGHPVAESSSGPAMRDADSNADNSSKIAQTVKVLGSGNSLIVNGRQRGNPILKFVRNVPWEHGDIVADYQLGKTSCALFLSLRYHTLNPNYIHERLKRLGHSYDVRVLLVQVDVKDPHHALKELAQICLLSDTTLVLAFSAEEAGRYLETFKSYENKPPDLIMEKTESNFLAQFTDCITNTRKVNKTDATTLLTTFGSFAEIAKQSEENLSLCQGFGPNKAKRLYEVMHEPFLKSAKKLRQSKTDTSGSPQRESPPVT